MIYRTMERDRPTYNTLKYLTSIIPHKIERDPFLVDPFVKSSLEELTGYDSVLSFGQYTRSFYTLEGHYENLWKYDRQILPPLENPFIHEAIRLTDLAFSLPSPARAISWYDLESVPFIQSSAAGYGYMGKKGDHGNHATAIRRAVATLYTWHESIQSGSKQFRFKPDLAWTRTQLAKPETPKIRHVWGAAFENIILEGITAAPLINAYRAINSPMVIGMHIYKRLPAIIQSALWDGSDMLTGVGLDIKSFDSSVQPWLINVAFDILKRNITFDSEYEELSFEFSRRFFIDRPVVMPDGRMWLKRVGVPSGSYFTQLVDSIVNYIAVMYCQLRIYHRTFTTYVLGDDSLFGIPLKLGYPELDLFATHMAELGLTLSVEKSIISGRSDELEFLGHCARGLRCSRDDALLMRLSLYPEFPVLTPEMSLTRMTGILLDTALCSWPALNLYRYMMIKYRDSLTPASEFTSSDKNWIIAVMGCAETPTNINPARIFTLT